MYYLLSPKSHSKDCRDLDPKAISYLAIGSLMGLAIYGITAIPGVPMNSLIHERGIVQPFSLITGSIVLSFVCLKCILLARELKLIEKQNMHLILSEADDSSVQNSLTAAESMRGVLAGRWHDLLNLWLTTHSTSKVKEHLETRTEAFELAQQNSFSIPRILVWAIPVLGFLGTVIGIGSAVGQFDSFLSNAEDIDAMRDGLANVTSGLGTAFDTTFLALAISLLVMVPLVAVERHEQRLITRMDLVLRQSLLTVLPDANQGGNSAGIDEHQLQRVVGAAFEKYLPNAEALVEPAKVYAEHAAQSLTEHLDPIKTLAQDSADAINSAKKSVDGQVEAIKASLDKGADRLDDSVQSLQPLLNQLNQVQALSSNLDHELKQLQSGAKLTESLADLKAMLSTVDQAMNEVAKPRKVVLVEQTTNGLN